MIVGVRSGTVLDPKLMSELRAVAARTEIAQRVLTILEPGIEIASRRPTPTPTLTRPAREPSDGPGVDPVVPCERSSSALR